MEMTYSVQETVATRDRRPDTAAERRTFASTRRAQTSYARALRRIARHVGDIVVGLGGEDPRAASADIERALRSYAEVVRPWARTQGRRMVAEVSRRDEAVWRSLAATMSRELRTEIAEAPIGELLRGLLREQEDLITSIPLEAARRVHALALEGTASGARAGEIREMILSSGEVARSRAELIARTETARASSGLVEARARHVGSEGYVWRTAEDLDVRKLHRQHAGKFFRWDDPPIAGSSGERAHAGQIYNCRCYPEPVIPEE